MRGDLPVEPEEFDPATGMTKRRVERMRSVIEQRQPDLHLVLENVHDPHNVSAVLRTCDAVGVGSIHLVYTQEEFPTLGRQSSAGAWKWADIVQHGTIEECYSALRSNGCKIYATDLNERSESIYSVDMTRPVALVFGNEHRGVSEEASRHADGNILIPMLGMVRSLNISVACAVTLYEAFRQRMEKGCYDSPARPAAEVEDILEEWSRK